MKLFNRLTQSNENLEKHSDILNGLYADNGIPIVRGTNETRTIKQSKISFKGELLPIQIQDRFTLLAKIITENLETSQQGKISSLIFFENPNILKLSKLEQALKENIFHLEEICHRPTLDLKLTAYKTPVSRARRITSSAITYLASHSEDWHSQTFVGVKPARVIALHREDQWDIYENLAVKNLIEYLNIQITQRLQTLVQLDNAFDELCEFYYDQQGGMVTANYIRLLGLHFHNDDAILEQQNLLGETKQSLEQLQRQLRGLMGTLFYRQVSNKKIPLQLQLTNLLQNHQHYRYIAIFWDLWLQENSEHILPENEIIKAQEVLCQDLEKYMKLLIINSLNELHFKFQENDLFQRDNSDKIIISEENGRLSLSSKYRKNLYFFVLPSDISLIKEIQLPDVNQNIILLYPTENASINIDQPSCYRFNIKNLHQVYTVPISTLSLYSQEQITTILQRWIIQSLHQQYPRKIEKVSTNMKKFIAEKYKDIIHISKNTAQVIGQQQGNFEHTWLAYLKSTFSYKDHPSKEEKMVEKFTSAFDLIEKINKCPVCAKAGQFNPSNNGTFRCYCFQCKTEWVKDMKQSMIKLTNTTEKSFKNYARYYI